MEIQSGIDLTGKVAVVTGAGRGIGAAIAGAFAEAGADIVVADLNHESARQAADRLTGLGRRALAVNGGCRRSSAGQSAIRYRSD